MYNPVFAAPLSYNILVVIPGNLIESEPILFVGDNVIPKPVIPARDRDTPGPCPKLA